MPSYGFGGGGGRATQVVTGSPFVSKAALETWSQANPTQLINNNELVSVAVVAGAVIPSDNGTYQWSGSNLVYSANAWVDYTGLDAADIKTLYESNPNTNAFTNADDGTVTSLQNLADAAIPMGSGPNVAASGLVVDANSNYILSDKALSVPDAGAITMGNFDFSNAGASVIATELATGRKFYPVAYELLSSGSSKAWRENFGPEVVTPAAASAIETFTSSGTNNSIEFAIVNVGRGSATQYTWTIPPGAAACNDVNLVIQIISRSNNPPVFDYRASTGGPGFDFPANPGATPLDVPMPLPRPAFFQEGIVIYVTLSAPAGQTLQLMGQTLTLPVVGTQTIPRVAVLGRVSTLAEIPDTADTIGSIVAGTGVSINTTNPRSPVISAAGGNRLFFFPDASNALSTTAVKTALATANSVGDWNAETLNTLTTDYTTTAGAKYVWLAIPSDEAVSSYGVSTNGGSTWTGLTPAFKFYVDKDGVNYAVYVSSATFTFPATAYRFRFTTAQSGASGISYTGPTPANQELLIGTGVATTAQRSGITLVGGRIPNTSIGVNSVQVTGSLQLDNSNEWSNYRFRRIQFTGSGNYVRGIFTLPYLAQASARGFPANGDWIEVMNIGGTGSYNCQIQTHDVGEVMTGSLTGSGPTIPVSQTAVYRITYTGNNNTWLVSAGASGTAGGDPVPNTYWLQQDDGSGIYTPQDIEVRAGMQLLTQKFSVVGSATSINLNTAEFTFTEHVGAASFFKYLSNDPLFPAVEINQAIPSMSTTAAFAYLDGTVLNTSYTSGRTIQPDGLGALRQITYQSGTTMRAYFVISDVTNISAGATLYINGALDQLNNGSFLITNVQDFAGYQLVDYTNPNASSALNVGDTTYTVAYGAPSLFWRVTQAAQGTQWIARCQFALNDSFSILAEIDPNWFTPGAGHVSWLDNVYQQVAAGEGGSIHADSNIHANGNIVSGGEIEGSSILLGGKAMINNVHPTITGQVPSYDSTTNQWAPSLPLVSGYPVPAPATLTSANYWQVLTFDNTGAMSMQFPRFAGYPVSRLDTVQTGDSVRFDATAGTWYNSRTAGSCFARRNSANQAIANLTDVRVAFDTGDSYLGFNSGDVGFTYDGTTNVGRFTNSSGRRVLVSVTYQVPWAANAAGIRFSWIRINGIVGNRVGYVGTMGVQFGDITCNNGSAVFALDNNQYFEVWVYQSSGGSLNIGNVGGGIDTGFGTRIQIARLNP